MGKALPILGVVAAVFAMLAALVLFDAAVFLVVPVAIAGSIVLLAQRSVAGAVAGLVVLGLAVLAALGLMGSVTTEDSGSADFGISPEMGRVWAVAACLAVPVGAVASRWDDAEPRWLAWAGVGLAVVALGIAFAQRDALADQQVPLVLLAGALTLAPIGPMVALLRSDGDLPPAPPA